MYDLAQRYGFYIGLFIAILGGIFLPQGSSVISSTAWLPLSGIWLVFFRQGISIPAGELAEGRNPLRLHIFVLSWNFLLFPLVTTGLLLVLSSWAGPELQMGFRLLSIMPTTIASAIALTSASGGNVPNALFSTVYSNLSAVVWVPVASIFYLSLSGGPQPNLFEMLLQLSLLIALPLCIGQVFRSIFPEISHQFSIRSKWLCPLVILLLVYSAFSGSVQSGGLDGLPAGKLAGVAGLTGAILFLVSGLVWWSAGVLRIDRKGRIAAFYCASQKSLATGVPLAATIIAASGRTADSALLLLPLLVYHPFQLLFASLLQSQLKK